jgi:outer membrane protein assembly factor BamA
MEFQTADNRHETNQLLTLGMNIDLTDDRQDPRKGFRFEANRKERLDSVDPIYSEFIVYDANLSAYIPIGHKNTWVWNAYRSSTRIKHQGSTNYAELQGRFGFGCGSIADPAAQAECDSAESQYINSLIANNRYGTSSALGGTQRLRSYLGGRFYAGETLFIGTEFRWNLTDEYTPMDWYILKGHRTNMQISFFAEAGSVSETSAGLTDKFKYSYGVGFRMLFEGTTLRADIAHGDEGTEMILFIDYPFSMFSVDSPG